MRLLKNGALAGDDWVALDDDDAVPQGGDVIVSFDRLSREHEALKGHNGNLAALFPNDLPVETLSPYIDDLSMVVLHFPAFADGRAYSQARQLRRQFGFGGEIRARGNVLPDQLAFMRSCGFDVFEVTDHHGLEVWQQAAAAMTVSYQRDYTPDHGFSPADVLQERREKFK